MKTAATIPLVAAEAALLGRTEEAGEAKKMSSNTKE
jgi:hypothetical protein